MKFILLIAMATISVSAHADNKQYFVKVNGQFKSVDKFEATRAKIIDGKTQVLACTEERVTKKATLKAVSSNDD